MNKLWHVAFQEYKRHVFLKRFIFSLLSLPLVIGMMLLLIFVMELSENDPRPLGYVDHSGVLAQAIPVPATSRFDHLVDLVPYDDEAPARAALDSGEIQAYYLLPPDYLETNHVTLVYVRDIGSNARRQFVDFLQLNLLAGRPDNIVDLAMEGPEVIVRTPDGSREFSRSRMLSLLLPVFASMALVILILTSSGYLIGAVAEEKESRTMEILITSISPNQLISGKLLGITAVVITQALSWLFFGALFIFIGGSYFGYEWLQDARMDFSTVVVIIAVMLPTYVLFAALLTAAGAAVSAVQEGQQIAGFFSMLLWIPFMLLQHVMESPNSPLVVGLSLLPVTSPMIITMRNFLTIVPTWQVVTSVLLSSVAAAGAVWLAGRSLRAGMLRYGQRLKLGELFKRS
ncbi:MAG: ABC transporter permease [Anaerolineae bacterium]|nr:ABC transporter permease [Anaerolineae bacterium]